MEPPEAMQPVRSIPERLDWLVHVVHFGLQGVMLTLAVALVIAVIGSLFALVTGINIWQLLTRDYPLAGGLVLLAAAGALPVAGWQLHRRQQLAWQWLCGVSRAAGGRYPSGMLGPVVSGEMRIGETTLPLVRVAVTPEGLLIWRHRDDRRHVPRAEIRELRVHRIGRWPCRLLILHKGLQQHDRFTVPWHEALTRRVNTLWT